MQSFFRLALLLASTCFSAYQGPVAAITSGYGAPGSASVAVDTVTNSHWRGNPVFVFHPAGRTAPVPTIFYAHGYGGNDTLYQIELLRHIASRGWAAVFAPYRTYGVTVEERYATLLDGFQAAVKTYPSIFDTSRVGFFGHSFGAGTLPYLASQLLSKGWGKSGSFLYCSAPWYSYNLGDTALSSFPSNTALLTVLYQDDTVNDHRMGIDIFRNIAIADSLKDCLLVASDTLDGYVFQADHSLPSQYAPQNGEYDAYDSRITFRLLDALADYAFEASAAGRAVALGGGDSSQVTLGGGLTDLSESRHPVTTRAPSSFSWPCDTLINLRKAHCSEGDASAIASRPRSRVALKLRRLAAGHLRIDGAQSIAVRDLRGTLRLRVQGAELPTQGLPEGLYQLETEAGSIPYLQLR